MIEVKRLTKFFDTKKAVDDVSFTVEKGEILGFLGPNGAGKSTTMRMITGFLPPTAGTAVIGGCDIIRDSISAREKIGYLPENAPVYRDMSVTGFLDFCAEIRGFTGTERKKRVAETIEKCFLTEVRHQPVNTLSKGFNQRVCFAQSILHDPEYLIFDEPTDGLDPNQKHEVRLMIREMSARKVIILSTHILDEVDAVCTRAIIIARGTIVADDSPDRLRALSPSHGAVALTLAGGDPETLLSRLGAVSGVRWTELLENDGNRMQIRVHPEDPGGTLTDRILPILTEGEVQIRSLTVERGRLDEVFRTITTSGADGAMDPAS